MEHSCFIVAKNQQQLHTSSLLPSSLSPLSRSLSVSFECCRSAIISSQLLSSFSLFQNIFHIFFFHLFRTNWDKVSIFTVIHLTESNIKQLRKSFLPSKSQCDRFFVTLFLAKSFSLLQLLFWYCVISFNLQYMEVSHFPSIFSERKTIDLLLFSCNIGFIFKFEIGALTQTHACKRRLSK